MASGLLIKQKQLIAGDGITIEHAQTSSTISLSNSTLNAAVRIYDATIASDTGVVTITDGTPVADLNIGDEIRTPDGVYQKVKDSITTTGPADGSRIEVSGITSPAEANGFYILTETDRKWKHESADYWILVWQNTSWMISPVESGANPGYSLFYGYMSSPSMPWEVTSWSAMSGAAGTPVVENAPAEQVITNTIDLFEYASTSVASADIVQSVNGNKPDASGNVTIETGSSVDESRLLPETPEDGDVPVFNATSTVGGGNDETVKLLIQPSTSENQIVDSAAGNVVPVSLSIEGDITVSEEGIMQFTQSQTISVPMAFSTVEMITGNSEWCLDFEFIPPTDLNDDNEFWSLYNDEQSYVGFWRGSMGDIVHMPCFGDIPGFTRGEKHLLTFEQWKDGETWKLSGYRNGSIGKTVETLIPVTTSQDISFGHGNKRKFRGQIVSIRFRNVAPYRGTSFQPDATPYTVPQVVGAWENQNLNEQIDAKIATHNTSLDAHPMQGATTNDYNGLDTNCSWYLSYGNNTSNVNAPANGPFFVITKKWTNSSGTSGAGMQIAIRNMTGNLVNQAVYIRTWSMSSGWRTWQKVGSSAMAGIPNYGAGVDITSTLQQGVYAAPSAGWIYATANGVSISGNLIGNVTQIVLPVAAGDTITADVVTIAKFYPNR